MARRGVYTKALQNILDTAREKADKVAGWAKLPDDIVATKESIKNHAYAADYWNPLWRDDNYARGTRWGGIIAFPMYQGMFWEGEPFFGLSSEMLSEAGFQMESGGFMDDEWEFFKPIRPGDTFRIWRNSPVIKDLTSLDGKGPHTFKMIMDDYFHINQKEELVSRLRRSNRIALYDKPHETMAPVPELWISYFSEPRERVPLIPNIRYRYTKKELEFIYHVMEEEEIRGADIRWWEDVNVGDVTKPVVLGPTTPIDTINHIMGNATKIIPMREGLKESKGHGGWISDPDTGVYHHGLEAHFSDYSAGLQNRRLAFLMMPLARDLAARLATNWMGDDAFLRRLTVRYISETLVGDTLIGRGKVTKKRVNNNEHIVDLTIWIENMRGYLASIASATVTLCMKDDPYQIGIAERS